MKRLFIFFIAGLALTSCGKKSDNNDQDADANEAVYKLNLDNTSFQWEAYKFNERTGVKGTFGKISTTPETEVGSLEDIIKGLAFEIDVNSVNSGDSTRDPKIIAHFFGSMMNTDVISGKITKYTSTGESSADVDVDITMNDKTVSVPSKITFIGKIVQLKTSVDLAQWDAVSSVDSLNKVCEALHTGADGESKLWPDVSITVNSTYFEAEANW